jgi:hypothetical protein
MRVVIHAINAKCASLTGAAALLPRASRPEADELVALMANNARSLLLAIETYQGQQGGMESGSVPSPDQEQQI